MLFLKTRTASLLLHTATVLLLSTNLAHKSHGANFVWDATSGTANAQDGGGTWTATGGNWYDETNNLQNQAWSNAAGNTAVFGAGGTGGIVNVTGTVDINGLLFRGVGSTPFTPYTLQGGTINLGASSAITIADGASSAAVRIDIKSTLSGNNLTIQKAAGSTALGLISLSATTNNLTGTLSLVSADAKGLFVQAGTVGALNSATLTAVDVGVNSTLVLSGVGTYAVPFILRGNGAETRGAIRFEVAGITLSGAITLAENSLITQNTNATGVSLISSNIGETGGSKSLKLGTQGSNTTGTIALAGNNTFTGGLIVEAANVRLDSAGALNSTTPNLVTFTDTVADRKLSLNGNSVTIAGLESPSITVSVRNAHANAVTLTLDASGGAERNFKGALVDGAGGGALSIVKNGTFAQAFSGTNTFTGGVTLNQGTLNLNSSTALGATESVFTINGGTLGNSNIAATAVTIANNNAMFWNGNFTYSATAANTLNLGTGAVSLGTASGTTRTVTVSTSTLTVGGSISNGTTANALTKAGDGMLVLAGNNTYTGVTTVSGGTLRVAHGNALGSNSAGTVVTSTIGRVQLEGNITVNGESLQTPFLDNVSGDNVWNGTIQSIAAAPITFDVISGRLLITGNVNAADAGGGAHTLNLVGSGTGEISGVISNTFGFGKNGTGTWILSGANTYTSATNITAGVLQVGKNGVGQTGTGTVAVASGARLTGTGTVRGTTVNLNSGSFLYAGDGIANSNHGTLTFSSATAATYNLNAGSTITLSLGGATVTDGTFGGNDIGSAGYNTWVDGVSGAGNHDRLVFTAPSGTLTINSNILVIADGFTPSFGQAFNLLDWATALGTPLSSFTVGANRVGFEDNGLQFDLPDLSGTGWYWDVSRFTTSGVVVVVPEPGRFVLLTFGLAALVMRRRRTKIA